MSSVDPSYFDPDLPEIDERLVAPGSRYEILDGVLIHMPPADPPHATRHSLLAALVEAHAAPEFRVACDMLTRTSKTSDIAPDVSVFPRAPHPQTGGRQLEHVAFEIVSTESLGHAGKKAASLTGRGVRRVFAIDVERERALEWSRPLETWSVLEAQPVIHDPALAVPLPLHLVLRDASIDDALARALVARRNPVFEAALADREADGVAQGLRDGVAQGLRDGVAQGLAEVLLSILGVRGLFATPQERACVHAERDPARLRRWLNGAMTCASVAALLAAP
jgi:Uma2 family endonuclease